MKQFAKIAAVLAALILACAFIACSDSNDESRTDEVSGFNGDSVVCTYIQSDDASNYYIFYADGTVEGYVNNTLENARDTLRYEGKPLESGTVTLKTNTGATLLTFTVKEEDGTIVAVTSLLPGFETTYTVKKESTENTTNANGDNGNTDGSTGDSSNDKTPAPGNTLPTDAAVCTWSEQSNPRNYYIFYADKTAEYYLNGILLHARSSLIYAGNPTATGTITIVNKTYDIGSSFTIATADNAITATDISNSTTYTVSISDEIKQATPVVISASSATLTAGDIITLGAAFYAPASKSETTLTWVLKALDATTGEEIDVPTCTTRVYETDAETGMTTYTYEEIEIPYATIVNEEYKNSENETIAKGSIIVSEDCPGDVTLVAYATYVLDGNTQTTNKLQIPIIAPIFASNITEKDLTVLGIDSLASGATYITKQYDLAGNNTDATEPLNILDGKITVFQCAVGKINIKGNGSDDVRGINFVTGISGTLYPLPKVGEKVTLPQPGGLFVNNVSGTKKIRLSIRLTANSKLSENDIKNFRNVYALIVDEGTTIANTDEATMEKFSHAWQTTVLGVIDLGEPSGETENKYRFVKSTEPISINGRFGIIMARPSASGGFDLASIAISDLP